VADAVEQSRLSPCPRSDPRYGPAHDLRFSRHDTDARSNHLIPVCIACSPEVGAPVVILIATLAVDQGTDVFPSTTLLPSPSGSTRAAPGAHGGLTSTPTPPGPTRVLGSYVHARRHSVTSPFGAAKNESRRERCLAHGRSERQKRLSVGSSPATPRREARRPAHPAGRARAHPHVIARTKAPARAAARAARP
jgi:hypothetical protein